MPKKLERDDEVFALRALHQVLGGLGVVCECSEIREQHRAAWDALEQYFDLYYDNADKMFTVPQMKQITEQLNVIKARAAVALFREAAAVDQVMRNDAAQFPDAPGNLLALLERNLAAAQQHNLTEILPRFTLALDAWLDLSGAEL